MIYRKIAVNSLTSTLKFLLHLEHQKQTSLVNQTVDIIVTERARMIIHIRYALRNVQLSLPMHKISMWAKCSKIVIWVLCKALCLLPVCKERHCKVMQVNLEPVLRKLTKSNVTISLSLPC
jgi:hypothetical protein